MATKNLGQVQAIWIGTTAPTNTAMLWYDINTGVFIHKFYNSTTSLWEPFILNGATSPLFRNGSVIELHYSTDQFEVVNGAIQIKANVLSASTPPFTISQITDLATQLGSKVDKVPNKSLVLDTEILRLASVGNYTHPTSHLPTIIAQDTNNRFVSDAEKAAWDSKQAALGYTPYDSSNPDGYITAAYFLSNSIPDVRKLSLPSHTTVAGRCLAAVEGVDYPTGWVLAAAGDNANDLLITHNLGKNLSEVTVMSISLLGRRWLPYPSCYTGLLEPTNNIIRVEGLSKKETQLVISIIFS